MNVVETRTGKKSSNSAKHNVCFKALHDAARPTPTIPRHLVDTCCMVSDGCLSNDAEYNLLGSILISSPFPHLLFDHLMIPSQTANAAALVGKARRTTGTNPYHPKRQHEQEKGIGGGQGFRLTR